jgi:ice-binding like protein
MKQSCLVVLACLCAVTGITADKKPPVVPTQSFAVLAGTAVTCTTSTIMGDVGVWPGTAISNTGCAITGALHSADAAAQKAFLAFVASWNNLRDHPPACDATHTGSLVGDVLTPGVYCLDSVAKAGTLTLDAQGKANATWLFLVDGALTGTGFKVAMLNGGDACNVSWWTRAATTMTDSNLAGNVLAGAAVTVTGGTFRGNIAATAGVTLKDTAVTGCATVRGIPTGDTCDAGDDHGDKDHGDDDKDHKGDKDKDKGDKDKKDDGHDKYRGTRP